MPTRRNARPAHDLAAGRDRALDRCLAGCVTVALAFLIGCTGTTSPSPSPSAARHAPARIVILFDRAPSTNIALARAAALAVVNVLSNTDDVGLALVPARSMTRGGERPLAVPIAPLDAAQRSSLRAALADPSAEPPTEVGGRPIYDALAAAYTTMTDGYVANRANMIVALVAGPNSDVDAADDDAQLAGLVGELRVGASGANAHPVRVVAIVLAQASIEPSAPVVAALTKVGRASNGNAAVANSAADAAEVVASALAEPPR